MDTPGLQAMYFALGQMSAALVSHDADAQRYDIQHGTGLQMDLEDVKGKIDAAQAILARDLKLLIRPDEGKEGSQS